MCITDRHFNYRCIKYIIKIQVSVFLLSMEIWFCITCERWKVEYAEHIGKIQLFALSRFYNMILPSRKEKLSHAWLQRCTHTEESRLWPKKATDSKSACEAATAKIRISIYKAFDLPTSVLSFSDTNAYTDLPWPGSLNRSQFNSWLCRSHKLSWRTTLVSGRLTSVTLAPP